MTDQNQNTHSNDNMKAKAKGFWQKHGRKVLLTTGGIALAGGGVAVGIALKAGGYVGDIVEDVSESVGE